MKKERGEWGVRSLFLFTFLAAAILVVQLFKIQVVQGKKYEERASDQYITPAHHLLNRGTIYMQPRTGKPKQVAMVTETYVLYINPQALTKADPEKVFNEINNITEIDREIFFKSIAKEDDPYEIIKKGLPLDISEEIASLNYIGVGTHAERERTYPDGSLASQVIGFTSYNEKGTERTGTYGIERYYEDILSDSSNKKHVNIFADILLNNIARGDEGRGPSDIILTIEPTVQYYVEGILKEYNQRFSSDLVGAIIMDPKTGAIVSMASKPDFDLNNFERSDPTLFSNPNTSNVYEMGSVIKPLTVAVGLDSGAINANSVYHDVGYIRADGATITNVYKGGRGDVTVGGILLHSMNTGVSWIVSKMGNKQFADYFKKLGFGEKTGIDMPHEATGLIGNLNSPRTVEYYTASFGQGIATTPLATTRALATLANGGLLVQPHLVKEIHHSDGKIETPKRNTPERVLKESVVEDVTEMLIDLPEKGLNRSIPTHSIAAKTGTAQIADPHTGKYFESEFLHSFFGYFPAYDPKFIIFLYSEKPKGVDYASQSLTDPFFKIVNFLIDYYEVSPDR